MGGTKRIPFVPFDGPAPQDSDALRSYDREVFERHPGWRVFCRPLVGADGPAAGTLTRGNRQLTSLEAEEFRTDFSRGWEGCNGLLVIYLAKGMRTRMPVRLPTEVG
jgi:hypothetical protein